MESITGRANEKIKYAVRLRDSAAFRKSEGRFFIEGARLCADAASSGEDIQMLFATQAAFEKYAEYIGRILPVCRQPYIISEEVADKLSDTKNAQGIFCVCKMLDKNANISKIIYDGKYVALEELSNPSNFGAICRTAEALGLDGIIVSGGCDIYSPKAQRAAMGALFRLPVIGCGDFCAFAGELKAHGMNVLASVPSADARQITAIDKTRGTVLIIGNEGNGLSQAAIDAATECVTIPMKGRAESLNAAAAASIMMWEMMR